MMIHRLDSLKEKRGPAKQYAEYGKYILQKKKKKPLLRNQ